MKANEDRVHLLYALPGLEMAAKTIIEQINSIRATLGQPAWAMSDQKLLRHGGKHGGRRPLSEAARARIAAAQRKRWADQRAAAAGKVKRGPKPGQKLSAKQLKAMRQNIAKARAAQKAA